MKNQVLVRRYTQGLVNSIKNEHEFAAIYHQLVDFEKLLSDQKKLQETLVSPFLPISKKAEIAKEILAKVSLETKASRFIYLLVENNRLELLHDILEYLPDLWSEESGISAFEVFSVIPLTDVQKKRLEERLERVERRPVFLKYKKDPSLLGGLSIKRGNVVYDVSIKGHLTKLKEIISEG